MVLILAFAVFSAVLMDLLAVFTVPLAVEDACLMVLLNIFLLGSHQFLA